MIPSNHLHRKGDPWTSKLAAIKAAKASRAAAEAVEAVMKDGTPRIDEEIWSVCYHSKIHVSTRDVIEHARKALVDCGVLSSTGRTKNTSNGCRSEEWVYDPSGAVRAQRPIAKAPPAKTPSKEVLRWAAEHIEWLVREVSQQNKTYVPPNELTGVIEWIRKKGSQK